MSKPRNIPFSKMENISVSGIFIKRFDRDGTTAMKSYAHRDDYYIFVLLTGGSASIEIDFERKELNSGDILIVSPWQVHRKPADGLWCADGWLVAFSPEMLSESDVRVIDEYSISPHTFSAGVNIVEDIVALCSMLERNSDNDYISNALASAVKCFVLSALDSPDKEISGRYTAITLKLRKLLDRHLTQEKSPAAYAAMLNISEVYLNEAVKCATGLSAGAYIRGRVIVQAKRQLTYTSLSAKEIAYSLGYDDYTYFSKLFRKCVGMSPSDYRKNLK